jgi:phosphate transport system substrate-binding protein
MLQKRTTIALLLACALLTACNRKNATDHENAAPDGSAMEGRLHLTGSSTAAPLMAEIARRFQTLHPKVAINIEMGGSARGISDVRDGKADIGMVSRVVADKEQDLKGFPVARDGLGLLVHKDNPVTTLTATQVTGIFTGRIKNWGKVGGANAPIVVINRDEGRGFIELFTAYFKIKYSEMKRQTILGDNSPVFDAVAARPNAISLVSVVAAENQAKAGVPVKLVALDGVAATRSNILSGNYPLARPLTLVTRGLPAGLVEDFIEFSLSPQAVDIIETMGFVPYLE